jgi:uncharacterized protein (TIGR02996 family)
MSREKEQAFLTAIREEPADDGVRLIFADWLEDHGQADRVEFIRAQIALDTGRDLETPLSEERRAYLERRTAHLLHEHQEWKRPLTELRVTDMRASFWVSLNASMKSSSDS